MKQFIFLIIIFPILLFGLPLNKHTLMDISKTYGYYQGQLYSLNTIKKRYPKLSNNIFIAKSEFDISFSKSIKNLDNIMSQYNYWKSIKKDIIKNINITLDLSHLTYQESIRFIQLVRQRAKGKIESPILETLLMLNPEYERYPEREFYDGFKKKYKCDDFIKSKGINFSIDIPMSWKSIKTNRPNIVRKFISQNGYGHIMAMILVLNFPDGKYLSKNNIESMINKKMMKDILPSNATLEDYGFIKLETLPGYWQRYSIITQRVKTTLRIEVLTYTIFYRDKLIQIQFQLGDFNNKKLERKFKKFKPLFDSIINSFILISIYAH